MKSKALMIGLLAAAGLMVAAGVTVAAGEVVSRPIGLNGAPDDLGRSLAPDSSAGQATTVRRTVTVRKRKPASAGASEVAPPGSYDGSSGGTGGGSGSGSSGGSSGGSGGQAKPAPPREDAPAPSGEDHGDDDSHDEGHQDDD